MAESTPTTPAAATVQHTAAAGQPYPKVVPVEPRPGVTIKVDKHSEIRRIIRVEE